MEKKKLRNTIIVLVVLMAVSAVLSILIPGHPRAETISEMMKDAVLHESGKISLFGIMNVNPAVISAYIVTAGILVIAILLRILVIPRFSYIPGKLQIALETAVGLFDGMAKNNSPHRNKALGGYIFAAGTYIFIGTLFELLGLQAVNVHGHSMSLGAPLADINGAISMGVLSYLFILTGGITNGVRGVGNTLKEFSLPISMSFRLFGALLSGLLVTELVYYAICLSFVLPVLVGILFTLIHALVQAYVLTMLTSVFYGEVSEPAGAHEA